MSNKIDHRINLTILPDGLTYEDKYRGWLQIFKEIADLPKDINVIVEGAPWSWVPILWYLDCVVTNSRIHFKHCAMIRSIMRENQLDRTSLEALVGLRPETADVLYKIDIQWKSTRRIKLPTEKEFIIGGHYGFFRKEITDFIDKLQRYSPSKPNVIIVPCAADKPYPSPLHKKVLEMMPSNYYMAVATGALGLVPQDLWDEMPWYDAGIPNKWRLMNIIAEYFGQNTHSNIIVYTDNQTSAIYQGLRLSCTLGKAIFVNPLEETWDMIDYLDLTEPFRLARLKAAFELKNYPKLLGELFNEETSEADAG